MLIYREYYSTSLNKAHAPLDGPPQWEDEMRYPFVVPIRNEVS